jgi:RNA polymerase sigma-70 factor (ECF subfamily)
MPTPPSEIEPRALLARWAAGDAAAVEQLVALCLPGLLVKFVGLPAEQIEAAVRRVFSVVPYFVVSAAERLYSLVASLVENELEAGAGKGLRGPERAESGTTVLDLDHGCPQPAAESPAEKNAWLKLGLMLLTRDDRALVLGHWAGSGAEALAAQLQSKAGEIGQRQADALQLLDETVRRLRRGELAAVSGAGEVRLAVPLDPWGMPTQWSMVLGAVAQHDAALVQQSWRRLLDRYRDPIRRAIRRAGRGQAPGDDLVEEFFSYLFEHAVLAKADPANGRFRAYIQAVLKRFLLKQGRGRRSAAPLSDAVAAPVESADARAERADESEWAAHVLALALDRLMQRSARDGEVLVRYYGIAWPDAGNPRLPQSREEIAADLGLSLGSVDQATHRARRQLRGCLEREVRATVSGADDYANEADLVRRRLLEAHPGLL